MHPDNIGRTAKAQAQIKTMRLFSLIVRDRFVDNRAVQIQRNNGSFRQEFEMTSILREQ